MSLRQQILSGIPTHKRFFFILLALTAVSFLYAGKPPIHGVSVEKCHVQNFSAGSWTTVFKTGINGSAPFVLTDSVGSLYVAGTLDRFVEIGHEFRSLDEGPVFFLALMDAEGGTVRLKVVKAEAGERISDFRLEQGELVLVFTSDERNHAERSRILRLQAADGRLWDEYYAPDLNANRFNISTIVEDSNPPDIPPPGGN